MDQTSIARLKAEIARLEGQLVELEAEVLDLERELDDFTTRYNRLVKPLQQRLDIIRGAISDLEAQQRAASSPPVEPGWTPPPGYVSVEEQFRRVWRSPEHEQTPPRPTESSWTPPSDYVPVEEQFRRSWQRPSTEEPPSEELLRQVAAAGEPPPDLKKLYRQLVRRYHPDLTTDPAERERRNRLMVEINDAYSRRDGAMLQSLAARQNTSTVDEPLSALYIRELQQVYTQLEHRVELLKRRRADLQNGEMMWLKIRESLDARQGRDLLREMAAELEREYRAAMAKLDALRRD